MKVRLPRALAVLAALGIALLAQAPARALAQPLATAIVQDAPPGADGQLIFSRVRAAGAGAVLIGIPWRDVGPDGPTRPANFDAGNPDDPHYYWGPVDHEIALALANGLEPMVKVSDPPQWATVAGSGSSSTPSASELGLFTAAAARRYDGTRPGLPRVRNWLVWNEPNASIFLRPQVANGQVVSASTYRDMVNDVAAGVHAVHPDNVVVAGELFPNPVIHSSLIAIGPMRFARLLFCMSGGSHPHRICGQQLHADVISVHPYSSGSPQARPAAGTAVWLGNLGGLSRLIAQAQRAGGLVSAQRAGFWVTEFAWNTNPPKPHGVPVLLDRRWVAEAMFRMWQAGVSLAAYFHLRDEPVGTSIMQNGLYYHCDAGVACEQPKPAVAAFLFPFVAYTSGGRAQVWGRTPLGVPGRVAIEDARGRALATLATGGDGIFSGRIALPRRLRRSSLHAVMSGTGAASPPFSLVRPPELNVGPLG